MASNRTLSWWALGFAVTAALVVALGWFPAFVTATHTTPQGVVERELFGLFMMSTLDDITHGLTALVLFAAAIKRSPSFTRLAFTAFGWYYALDAVFFLLNGTVNTLPWQQDILLNAPHVGISSIMLWLAYSRPEPAVRGAAVGVAA